PAAERRGDRLRAAARARVCRRAEPRRPDVRPASAAPADGAHRQAAVDPALRRPPDPRRSRQPAPAGAGRSARLAMAVTLNRLGLARDAYPPHEICDFVGAPGTT